MKAMLLGIIIFLGMLSAGYTEDAEYHLRLGDSYKRQLNYGAAKKEYEKVIELDPGSWIAYTELAHIYTMENNFSTAKELCLKALDYNNRNYMAWAMLGGCYHELGEDPQKTEEALRRSWSIRQSKLALMGLMGTVSDYEQERRYSEAENLLLHLLSLNPPENHRKYLEDWLKKIRGLKN